MPMITYTHPGTPEHPDPWSHRPNARQLWCPRERVDFHVARLERAGCYDIKVGRD